MTNGIFTSLVPTYDHMTNGRVRVNCIVAVNKDKISPWALPSENVYVQIARNVLATLENIQRQFLLVTVAVSYSQYQLKILCVLSLSEMIRKCCQPKIDLPKK